jgi:glycosyltransferase involved in cell wall biosynthesis/peptidoglycan/xylan/chitin deacetylase (PgdA/CDA1 family)
MIDRLIRAGTESQLIALIRGIDREKVEPHLCLKDGEDDESRSLEPDNCGVTRLGIRSPLNPRTWLRLWRFSRFLRREKIDVVQVYFPESTYYGVFAAWLAGVPRIIRTRNNLGWWMTPFHRVMGRLCTRFTHLLVANCEACRSAVIADEGIDPAKVCVLENGVDVERFPRDRFGPDHCRSGDSPRIGVVANLRPVKGLETFVKAAAIVHARHPEAIFEIAGEGPSRPALLQLAAHLGLGDRFRLTGSIDIDSVPDFIAGLDISVLPSVSEGLSNALLEYMAAGRAIVATAVGGNTRLIHDGVHGLIVPPENAEAMAAAFSRLLDDQEFAARLGAAAYQRAVKEYSRPAMLARFEDFYHDLRGGLNAARQSNVTFARTPAFAQESKQPIHTTPPGREPGMHRPDEPSRIVVFTTGDPLLATTIRHVEAIADAFPDWQITIMQEVLRRSSIATVRMRCRKLFRQPVSYPLELLHNFGAYLRDGYVGANPPKNLEQLTANLLARPNISRRHCGSLHAADTIAEVKKIDPWLGICLAAPILKPSVYSLPRLGTINLHKSKLPYYRGLPPGFWELHAGVPETGVSIHWVEEKLDRGPVVTQDTLRIPPFTTVRGLKIELDVLGSKVLVNALRAIQKGCKLMIQPQPDAKPNREPPWRVRRRVERRLQQRRKPATRPKGRLRNFAKQCALMAYAYLWAPVRNIVLARTSGCHTTVLLYHRVSDAYLDHVTVGIEQFERHLKILAKSYDVIDLETFLESRGKRRPRPAVVLTFDDGYADNYLAAQMLRRFRMPCTFFVSTRIVGTARGFEHDLRRIGRAVPTLTWEQIREMSRWGFAIGNHTARHADLGSLSLDESVREITEAKEDLKRELDGSVWGGDILAYPFGHKRHMKGEVRQSLSSLGIRSCLSAHGGTNSAEFDPLDVMRQPVHYAFSNTQFRAVVEGWQTNLCPGQEQEHPALISTCGVSEMMLSSAR